MSEPTLLLLHPSTTPTPPLLHFTSNSLYFSPWMSYICMYLWSCWYLYLFFISSTFTNSTPCPTPIPRYLIPCSPSYICKSSSSTLVHALSLSISYSHIPPQPHYPPPKPHICHGRRPCKFFLAGVFLQI